MISNSNPYIDSRFIDFLNESNKIDNIQRIDYSLPNHQKINHGHFGALALSQENARKREPLNVHRIVEWKQLIDEEKIDQFAEKLGEQEQSQLEKLLAELNENLKHTEMINSDIEFCKLVGTFCKKFDQLNIFKADKGRLERLLVNYIATYCRRPIIVFSSKEKEEYENAISSEKKMWSFIAKKIQEVILGLNGELMYKEPENNEKMTSIYKSPGGNEQLVEWHQLKKSIREWNQSQDLAG